MTKLAEPVTSRPTLPRRTIADLLHELGDIPPERVRLLPTPGTATEEDMLYACDKQFVCELVSNTLVEKGGISRRDYCELSAGQALTLLAELTTACPPDFPRVTVADLLHDLGDIPPERVRLIPPPGTATEDDAVFVTNTQQSCELISGTLVEKTMGSPESTLALRLGAWLLTFVESRQLGIVTGTDGMYRLRQGKMRMPDIAFTSFEHVTDTTTQVWEWSPDLCVEILSPSNSRAEMLAKRELYFASGCRLVWEVDPETQTVAVYTNVETFTTVDRNGALDGGDVLPGFMLPLAQLFVEPRSNTKRP